MAGLEDVKSYGDNIRAMLPAEVTSGYIAGMQYYNGLADRQPTETVSEMEVLFILLLALNVLIYVFVRKIKSVRVLLMVSVGFFLWCTTVDAVRANEIFPSWVSYAPALLIVYTLVSSLLPKEQ